MINRHQMKTETEKKKVTYTKCKLAVSVCSSFKPKRWRNIHNCAYCIHDSKQEARSTDSDSNLSNKTLLVFKKSLLWPWKWVMVIESSMKVLCSNEDDLHAKFYLSLSEILSEKKPMLGVLPQSRAHWRRQPFPLIWHVQSKFIKTPVPEAGKLPGFFLHDFGWSTPHRRIPCLSLHTLLFTRLPGRLSFWPVVFVRCLIYRREP